MEKRVLFMGDSIAADAALSFVPSVVQKLSKRIGQSVTAVNSSVPSSNVLDLLDRAQELLVGEEFSAAVVFVGINDSKNLVQTREALVPLPLFRSRLSDLAKRIEMCTQNVVLCGLPDLLFSHIEESGILDDYWFWRVDEYRGYSAAISEVSKESSRRKFVDLKSIFDECEFDTVDLFKSDGVHPNSLGQYLISSALVEELSKL
ncbi:SGNH/GDSL hydrolase family protein [Streptomyces sp. NPDC058954]|uniref:SGNH/GDSL hydrolase family protein n=1 Tax=Streptomyces sp. NPDC058954 TaxID=3346677 RepID=UPI00368CF5CC